MKKLWVVISTLVISIFYIFRIKSTNKEDKEFKESDNKLKQELDIIQKERKKINEKATEKELQDWLNKL